MEVTLEEPMRKTGHLHVIFVSILILLEVTLEEMYPIFPKISKLGFNPYSIGSYFGSFVFENPSGKVGPVSILILLEVTLEVYY